MKKTKEVILVTLIILISCFSKQRVFAQDYQENDVTVISGIAETEKQKGMELLEKNGVIREEVLSGISNYMDISQPCGLSKEDFVNLLENTKYDSKGFFSRNAETFWNLEQEYNINALFVCGISALESKWGTYKDAIATNNYTGQSKNSGKLKHYASEAEGIEDTFKNLSENYGNIISDIGSKYCPPNPNWASSVTSAMRMFFE